MQLLMKSLNLVPRSWLQAISEARYRHPLLRRSIDLVARRIRNRDGTIQQGVGRGLRFNTGPSSAGYLVGNPELDVQLALQHLLKPGMTLFDAGANVGFLSVLAARLVGPSGRVVCFEPLPVNADWIEHNARLNQFTNIDVRREALGGTDSQTKFLVAPETTRGMLSTSSFAKPENITAEEILIPVRSLDSLWAERAIPAPDLIKLDVEGVEAEALRGGTKLIRELRPNLLVELHDTRGPVSEILQELGYHTIVLGGTASLAEANWNDHVVAVPEERQDMIELAAGLCALDYSRV